MPSSGSKPAAAAWRGLHLSPAATSAAALVVLAICPFIVSAYFASDVLARAMLLAVLALSLDLAWGYTGILCLGQAAFFGVGAYAVAILRARQTIAESGLA
jgi:branched-chain amino acid transport system permease protein